MIITIKNLVFNNFIDNINYDKFVSDVYISKLYSYLGYSKFTFIVILVFQGKQFILIRKFILIYALTFQI